MAINSLLSFPPGGSHTSASWENSCGRSSEICCLLLLGQRMKTSVTHVRMDVHTHVHTHSLLCGRSLVASEGKWTVSHTLNNMTSPETHRDTQSHTQQHTATQNDTQPNTVTHNVMQLHTSTHICTQSHTIIHSYTQQQHQWCESLLLAANDTS